MQIYERSHFLGISEFIGLHFVHLHVQHRLINWD